jgi:5-formyltetrahydrofolate cyclo-ligase
MTKDEDLFLRRRVKGELRKRMRGLRQTMPASACAARSLRIVEQLMGLPPIVQARGVALFWPMEDRHEVDLRLLHDRLRDRGARLAYPASDAENGALTFHFVSEAAAMQPNALGVREPSSEKPEAAPGEIDVVLVPALAADPRGHRIGYGAGYYDRALPRFSRTATTVCVVFDFQLLVDLPDTPGDVPVAWIVTETRTLRAES